MTDPNEDLTLAARGLCKQRNNRAHWNAIDRGDWDAWGAMEAAKADLLKNPALMEDEE